jgi:moderate conductance mechanosensitive channel
MVENISEAIAGKLVELGDLLAAWFSDHIVNIIAIIVGCWLLYKFGAKLIARILKHTIRIDLYPTKSDREKRIKTLNTLIGAATKVVAFTLGVFLVIGEINPGYTAALFASAGLITVALGFGAQSLIKDFMSGIFIITENQYRVGDVIEIGGVNGTVEDVTVRTTVLRDLNGFVHHVPNGFIDVTTNKTIGYSRINEDMVLGFDSDVDRVEHIINHVGQELAADVKFKNLIIEAPEFASVKGYAVNGLIVNILAKTEAGEQWAVRTEMYRRLKKAFDKAGIEVTNIPIGIAATNQKKSKRKAK